ncbi:MAG: NAD(P)/FAD-dependent oxidoreductase [Acutalibacteraceae bacterium]
MDYDIICVGGGFAGMTAALYAARAGKSVIVIEKNVFGGQITLSPEVENYPCLNAVSGNELAESLLNQIKSQGVDCMMSNVTSVVDEGSFRQVNTDDKCYTCKAVIIATGAAHRLLGADGEQRFTGKGVSYCAVCDGAFFRNRNVAVVGGGSSALQEALYLSSICKEVHLIHRRDEYRAEKSLIQKVDSASNIHQLNCCIVERINGDKLLTSITLKSLKNGENSDLAVNGLFVSVGMKPQLSAFRNVLTLTDDGYAKVDDSCCAAGGIYVAGDCRKKAVRQLTTAVSDGTVAAVNACKFIDAEF